MRIEDYPEQEPLTPLLKVLHPKLVELSAGIGDGEEHFYGTADPCQGLMVYPAAQPDSPVLFFMHGGGWTNGYKEEMAFLAPALNARGITLVSASYRLAPKNVFPTHFDDAADAFALAYELADKYGYDRDALFIGGHSAGGHLASLLALRSDWQEARGLPRGVIKGCLPISGVFDFTPGNGMAGRPRFLGPEGVFNEVYASPIFQIGALRTPFFICYGSNDFPHLMVQAQKFAMVLRAKGFDVEMLEVADTDHGTVMTAAAEETQPWLPAATGWIADRLQR